MFFLFAITRHVLSLCRHASCRFPFPLCLLSFSFSIVHLVLSLCRLASCPFPLPSRVVSFPFSIKHHIVSLCRRIAVVCHLDMSLLCHFSFAVTSLLLPLHHGASKKVSIGCMR